MTCWRDGKYEVDYVVERGKEIWAIEVKSGTSGDAKGLERFRDTYPEAKTLMISGPGIPLEEFFSVPAARWVG